MVLADNWLIIADMATDVVEPGVADWDFPRATTSALLLARFAEQQGVGPSRCLRGTGIDDRMLHDPTALIAAHQEIALVRNLLDALGDSPGLGLAVGAQYHLTAYGIWGFALISSATVGDCVVTGLRYVDLTFAFSVPRGERDGRQFRLALPDESIPADVRRFLVERDSAAVITIFRDLLGGRLPLREMRFRFVEPASAEPYRSFFGAPVHFGDRSSAVVFDSALLDLPLPQANEHTAQVCQAQCQELAEHRRSRGGIASVVRERLLRRGGCDGGMEDAARALHVTSRTLRRKLAEEGTSYRGLVDEVRQVLAEDMLSGGVLPIETVATRLGYAEASSFIHAFRRWTGVTPAAYARGIRACGRAAGRRPSH